VGWAQGSSSLLGSLNAGASEATIGTA